MTNLEAIRCYIEPYEVSDGKLEILLNEQSLQKADTYNAVSQKVPMYKAVIAAMWSLITLKKEKDNGSELNYDVDAIKDLIKHYQKEIDEPLKVNPQNRDMTARW